MAVQVQQLSSERLDEFITVFFKILRAEFPGYTAQVHDYFERTAYSKDNFKYWLSYNLKIIYVALNELDNMVGFAVIDAPYGGVSLCRWLGVQKEYQRQKIGSTLIKTWMELAKKQKCHKVELAAQPEAKIFYEKVGLNLEGKRNLSYFGIDQYVFGKVIGTFSFE